MPAAAPTAPPRRRKELTKQDISEPYDFVHCAHVGLDFKSEDVRHAIKPLAVGGKQASSQSDNVYEEVSRQHETPILVAGSKKDELSPPIELAPEYMSSKAAGSSVPAKSVPVPKTGQEDVVDYENRPSQHIYQNLGTEKPRPSKKKNPPPPPPPQTVKPKIETPQVVEEAGVVLRQTSREQKMNKVPPEEMSRIDTPKRVEAVPVSVIIERPGVLGEMRLGLDDPIPLTTGIASSKYRSPSMLTPEKPKEMAVDVPTPMRTPEPIKTEKDQQRKSKAHLIKEAAVDVPPTPSAVTLEQKIILPEPIPIEQRRPAPTPPVETPDEPQELAARPVFVPETAARANPLLKNVISELRTKQPKDEIAEEEEEHEYVTVTGLRIGQGNVGNGAAPESRLDRQSVLNTEYVKLKKSEPHTINFSIKQASLEKDSVPVKEVISTMEMTPISPKKEDDATVKGTSKEAESVAKKPSVKKDSTKSKQELLKKEKDDKVAPVPVPKPRRTVVTSVDSKTVEDDENETRGAWDDGVDTGYSEEEAEVIRL